MDPIVNDYQGWFAALGPAGKTLQNVITVITPLIMIAIILWLTYRISIIATQIGNAEGPEQRKEAKIRLGLCIAGLILVIVGPTVILALMNTIYATVKAEDTGEGGQEYRNVFFCLQNQVVNQIQNQTKYSNLIYNLVN